MLTGVGLMDWISDVLSLVIGLMAAARDFLVNRFPGGEFGEWLAGQAFEWVLGLIGALLTALAVWMIYGLWRRWRRALTRAEIRKLRRDKPGTLIIVVTEPTGFRGKEGAARAQFRAGLAEALTGSLETFGPSLAGRTQVLLYPQRMAWPARSPFQVVAERIRRRAADALMRSGADLLLAAARRDDASITAAVIPRGREAGGPTQITMTEKEYPVLATRLGEAVGFFAANALAPDQRPFADRTWQERDAFLGKLAAFVRTPPEGLSATLRTRMEDAFDAVADVSLQYDFIERGSYDALHVLRKRRFDAAEVSGDAEAIARTGLAMAEALINADRFQESARKTKDPDVSISIAMQGVMYVAGYAVKARDKGQGEIRLRAQVILAQAIALIADKDRIDSLPKWLSSLELLRQKDEPSVLLARAELHAKIARSQTESAFVQSLTLARDAVRKALGSDLQGSGMMMKRPRDWADGLSSLLQIEHSLLDANSLSRLRNTLDALSPPANAPAAITILTQARLTCLSALKEVRNGTDRSALDKSIVATALSAVPGFDLKRRGPRQYGLIHFYRAQALASLGAMEGSPVKMREAVRTLDEIFRTGMMSHDQKPATLAVASARTQLASMLTHVRKDDKEAKELLEKARAELDKLINGKNIDLGRNRPVALCYRAMALHALADIARETNDTADALQLLDFASGDFVEAGAGFETGNRSDAAIDMRARANAIIREAAALRDFSQQ